MFNRTTRFSAVLAVVAAALATPFLTDSEEVASALPAVQESVEVDVQVDAGKVILRTAEDFGIPRPGMTIDTERTAIVITDPQNDFLSPDGVTWGVVGESVTENGTVEHLEHLFAVGAELDVPVFISPHYYFPHDHEWHFEGSLETLMHDIEMFERPDQLSLEGFEGSGADWLEQYKPYIAGDNVTVTSPHKVYGPETNDLILQLRKQGIDKVILGGMSANLCTESHMRELIEQGFEVTVVSDATAGAITPAGHAWEVALANYRYIASAVVTTEIAVASLRAAYAPKQS
ncbi:MAG: cysteine hydrolase [Planctomycetota bacterium]